MRTDTTKATLTAAWILGLGVVAASDYVTSGASRALVLAFGLVPPAVMWVFWSAPVPSLSESINRARR